ncbi:MAG TPA: PssD/Cps14F family polysaccharide biosynthesis glycosyltransferase [Chroococcidiopsis sp.]
MKILLVCSTGGHFQTLQQLRPFWGSYDHSWVTFKTTHTEAALQSETVHWAFGPANRGRRNLLQNFWLAWQVLTKEKPDLVLSTGAWVAVPFVILAKARGSQTAFVESVARAEQLSLSARLLVPFLDALYVYWPQLKARYPKAELITS